MDAVCFILKRSGKKGSLRVYCLLYFTFEERGEGKAGIGQVTSTSLFAPASAPGELEMHWRSQKTWVGVPALPLTTYVTLGKLFNISGSQFQYRLFWED